MWHLFRSFLGGTRKETPRVSSTETRVFGMREIVGSDDFEENELSGLSFTPEQAAEDFFTQTHKQSAKGAFQPVHETIPDVADRDWDLPVIPGSTDAIPATSPAEVQKLVSELELHRDERAFANSGPLPSMAVRSDEAAALKAKIGGEAVTLSLRGTLETVALAQSLGLPIVVAGTGLLNDFSSLTAKEYVISTLGSRSAVGNFVHALVISPVLSVEKILATNIGRAWLASIIRKEQLLVSYRPIRAATSCEDLAERAKAMPTDAITIISKQRGLDINS
ncbi:UNVERIFIED_ORG: hypothetical protein QE434_000792 [Rhizobium sp. SORGH_AS 755]|nr:hypothetical protein [Rhizobium sp. SORGH_AS_0755]